MPALRSASAWAIAAVMALFLLVAACRGWNEEHAVLRSDAKGYYGYLHALFIGHDLGHEPSRGEYVQHTPTGTLNKYFAGEAVMLLPFFLPVHAWVKANGLTVDGFGGPYADAIRVAALVYALLGLLALRALLRRLGVHDGVVAVVLLALGYGTQLLQYTALQPGWTHVYSFCCFAVFLRLAQRLADGARIGLLIAWGALFGLIVLLRPVNGLVLLGIPVVLGRRTGDLVMRLSERTWVTVLAGIAGAGVVAIQCALWHAQTGSFWAYGYVGEGFHWKRPEVLQVLFGIRRGLFTWTPVMLVAAIGVFLLWRSDRVRSVAALLYWAANVYVISSWWIWYYGSGFGHRAFIEHYVVFSVPMALALDRLRLPWRRAAYVFLVLGSALQLAQFHQYDRGILHPECMDRSKYAYTFLRFDDAHRDRLGGNYQCPPFNPHGMDTLVHEHWSGYYPLPHWTGRVLVSGDPVHRDVIASTPGEPFGPVFAMRSEELPKGRALYLAVGFDRFVARVDDTRGVLGVASVERPDGSHSYYEAFRMEPLPPHGARWEHIEYRIPLPPLQDGESIKFYFWDQRHNASFWLDDLNMTVFVVRPY